jgi:hypothetical protein
VSSSGAQRNLWALGGILFAAFFNAGDFLRGALAAGPLLMPGASAEEVALYFTESRTSALAVASVQVLSALSLLVFVVPVATLVWGVAGGSRALVGLTSGGGVLSAALLLACALLGFLLVPVAALTGRKSSLASSVSSSEVRHDAPLQGTRHGWRGSGYGAVDGVRMDPRAHRPVSEGSP